MEIKNKDLGHIEMQNENYVISRYSPNTGGTGNVTPLNYKNYKNYDKEMKGSNRYWKQVKPTLYNKDIILKQNQKTSVLKDDVESKIPSIRIASPSRRNYINYQ